MQQQILHLFFYGAIAFVPNNIRPSTEMTAYLMKVPSCAHNPLLSFEMAAGSSCLRDVDQCSDPIGSSTACCGTITLGGRTRCFCKLVDVDLEIDPRPTLRSRNIPPAPGAEIPDPGQEDDFAWLVRIANVNGTAKRAKSWTDIETDASRPITAHMQFGWDEAAVCHIDQNLKRANIYEADRFKFVPAGDVSFPGHIQALAEYVEFTSSLTLRPVGITLKDISGSGNAPLQVSLGCRGVCPDVFISNSLSDKSCADEDVGYHFVHYYDLSRPQQQPQQKQAMPIPVRVHPGVELDRQYSCGPGNGPLRVTHPLAQLREDLWTELVSRFRNNPKVERKDLEDLDGLFWTFGRDSDELLAHLRDLLREVTDADVRSKYRPSVDLIKLLLEWIRGIQSRIICPVAMFDP